MIKAINFLGKHVDVKIDKSLGSTHPKFGYNYPMNCVFVLGTKTSDVEEVDDYVLGVDKVVKELMRMN